MVKQKIIRFVWFILIIAGLIIAAALVYIGKGRMHNEIAVPFSMDPAEVIFTSKKTVTSGLPNSVVFQYDISKVKYDSAFIQQDRDSSKRTRITNEYNYLTGIYYYPGYYTAKLILNDQVVKEHPLLITTSGWMAVYKRTYQQKIPVYLKKISVIKPRRLHVSLEDLKINRIENDQNFMIGLYNTRDFGKVNCDSFRFETILKNDLKDGGLACQYVAITIEGEEGTMTASFGSKDCTSNLFLAFGDVSVVGSQNDLSAFAADMNTWQKIGYQVIDKNARIYLNDKEIYRLSYSRNLGRIIGMSYHFYGCGSVQRLKLWDSHDNLVYEEDYNK